MGGSLTSATVDVVVLAGTVLRNRFGAGCRRADTRVTRRAASESALAVLKVGHTRTPALLTILVGLSAAVILTVVHATGRILPQFHWWRLQLTALGFSLVTVPVPLLIYYAPQNTRAVVTIISSLYVLTVVVLFFTTPNKPTDED